jgi:hypothetical protein
VRLLGAVSGAALAVGLLPITAASAQVTAADVDDICPAPDQVDAFTDDTLNTFEDRINCAAAYDLVTGKTATTFDPQGFLTRGQAATILVNYVEVSNCGVELTTDATDDFTDVDGNIHEPNIQKAADNGIVNGYNDNTFRPDMLISRAQFATMAVQATELALGEDLTADANRAFDDLAGNVHTENIEKAFDNGMLVGTSPRMFSPNLNITRGQATSIVIGAAGQILFPAGEFCPAEPVGFETLVVSPAGPTTRECVDGTGDVDPADNVTITVTELSSTEVYRLTLVDADNISTDAEGDTTFVEDAETGLALAGTVASRIISVNGVAQTTIGQSVGAVAPINGQITFVIDCGSAESIVPVVYTDQGGANTRLNLDADGQPTEPFGIGGTITFTDAPPVQGAVTVTAPGTVVQGADVVVTVGGANAASVASVTVSGTCIATQTFLAAADEDVATAGLQFSPTVNPTAAVGDCVLTVATTFTGASGLTADSDTVTVAVTAAPPVQGVVSVTAPGTVVQGADVVVTVGGANVAAVASVTVSGACIATQTFLAAADEDVATAGLQFSPTVNPTATVGDCVLTVATTFTGASGLTADSDTVTVAVTAAPPVQGVATVTAGTTVVQGADVLVTIAGEDIELVTVSGNCIETQDFLAYDTDGPLFFLVAVNGTATVGACVLTVDTTFTEASGLTADLDTVTVAVTADVVDPVVSATITGGAGPSQGRGPLRTTRTSMWSGSRSQTQTAQSSSWPPPWSPPIPSRGRSPSRRL